MIAATHTKQHKHTEHDGNGCIHTAMHGRGSPAGYLCDCAMPHAVDIQMHHLGYGQAPVHTATHLQGFQDSSLQPG